jgi:hypothetical protein
MSEKTSEMELWKRAADNPQLLARRVADYLTILSEKPATTVKAEGLAVVDCGVSCGAVASSHGPSAASMTGTIGATGADLASLSEKFFHPEVSRTPAGRLCALHDFASCPYSVCALRAWQFRQKALRCSSVLCSMHHNALRIRLAYRLVRS